MSAGGVRRSVAAAAFLTVVAIVPLRAQTAGLERVEELAREGRTEEARASLLEWWGGARAEASRRDLQRGLWIRGRLTVDPAQAALDFQRLVVEYPGGPFSDAALFRLAQAAHERGDGARAQKYLATLERDYPTSPVRRAAEAWFADAGPPPPPPDELPVAAAESGRYAVQLGAFSSRDRAERLAARVREAGFDPRLVVVEGSRLVRVRVGRFDSAQAASVFSKQIVDRGFTAAVVRDALDEERIRR
jgi:SPOR domain/Tetratricopeptide repeat